MILTDVAIRNRTTVAVLGLIIVLLGVYSYLTLPREAFPDIPIPHILVNTVYEGISPADVETSVTMKIEKELNGIRGVKQITSSSAEGLSMIDVEFMPKVPTDVALQRVRDRVDLARGDLPDDIQEPVIKEINLAEFPIMQVSISGDVSPMQLKGIADDMQDAIETLPGVLKVDVLGALEPEIRMEFDRDRMAMYNLVITDIMQLIPTENVNISAGGLETKGTKFNVRIPAEFVSAEEVDHLLITSRNGKPIYLSDVATVRDAFKDRDSFSRFDGVENVTLSIQKRAGANVVQVSDSIKAVIAKAQEQLPGAVKFDLIYDLSKNIRDQVADLENNILAALILVAGILLIFMGLRTSMIVATIIPLTLLITFFLIQALGYTLNMIVLFSLVLVLGMLVDNAIVIVENIYRHMQLGYRPVEAAILGAREVAWPVTTSTLTTLAAFFPLMFWPGIMGDFMKYLPITLTVGLASSLFVALVFNPVISSLSAARPPKVRQHHWFIQGYRRFQKLGLDNPGTTLFLALCVLVGMLLLYAKIGQGTQFFPEGDPQRAVITVRTPQGTNIRETDRIVRLIEDRIKPYRPWIKHTLTNVGSAGGLMTLTASAGGPHLANVTLIFYDFAVRERPSTEVIAEIRQAVADIPGAEIKVEKEEEGPPSGAPVTARFSGDDFRLLEQYSEKARRMIENVPNLVNLRSDLEATRPELALTIDRRRAVLLGVNTATVGNFLKMAIFGTKVGTYRQFNDEYDITVRLPVGDRMNVDDLYRIQIPNMAGKAVPLSSLGRLEYRGGFGTINRVNQKRVVTLTADAEGRLSSAVLADVQKRLQPLGDPRLVSKDIQDWEALRTALLRSQTGAGSNPAADFWKMLPAASASSLAEALSPQTLDDEAKTQVLSLLNQAIMNQRLHAPESLDKSAGLSEQASQLLKRNPDDLSRDEVQYLNRQMLAAAFPGVILPNATLDLPVGYSIDYVGEREMQEESQAFLLKAFGIAFLLILLVMVIQFNSLLVPFVIMTTVVLSLIGALLGLLVCHLPFGIIMTGIGVISLAGVVVNNAIVLLDYTRQLQTRGMDLVSAAAEAGVTRLRPVLLTASTTIIGLIPMATGISYDFHTFSWATKSESAQWWRNMAVVVMFGLAFATVLTLVVVPSLYVMLTRASLRIRAALGMTGEDENETKTPEIAPGVN